MEVEGEVTTQVKAFRWAKAARIHALCTSCSSSVNGMTTIRGITGRLGCWRFSRLACGHWDDY